LTSKEVSRNTFNFALAALKNKEKKKFVHFTEEAPLKG
jgi:hypothetical protein